ncbi:MAG: rod shape-determining protein [Clostridiales bacterium]|nr:rod shape-determining protein [Clostridiales bacterium]MDY5349818.1 rod shape-determining protein [Candidatus Ventricola sp.]MDY5515257.1 rod shape-determining protein [Candidatus Ventricola sp.]
MFGVDELGMDLGTSTLHIVVRGKGVVLSEPAYVAYDRQTRDVVAVGEDARRMYGRTPAGLIVERPLCDGRIRSFDLVSKMLRYFVRKVIGKRAAFRPRMLLALPGGMAPSEQQTLVDVLVDAGVRSVIPVDECVASAIGGGLRIDQPYGRMNIDMGGGRTNVSVFSLGHQIVWDILDVGGDKFDEAIIDYLRKKHNLLIGARTAEELKINIGSARMRGVRLDMDACGRSLVSGLPRAVSVNSEEMIEALTEPLRDLVNDLHRLIERTPPELASDIFDEGITLSGGGAQLFGLPEVISDQIKIRTTLADEPDLCVAHGLSALIDEPDRYENIDLISGSRSDLGTDE